jgi:hypothetical protein
VTTTFTTNLRFPKPDFLSEPWQQPILDTFDAVDKAIFALYASLGVTVWANSTVFINNALAFDSADGSVWRCLIAHTSAISPTTFSADRIAHPTFWTSVSFITPVGPAGQRGNTVLSGSGVPSNVTGQIAGDFYIDTVSHFLYGPLIAPNTWGAGTNLVGPSGSGSGDVVHTRQVLAGGLLTGGGDLSADRTITATEASLAQAQTGTDHTTVMTPGRVSDAITALAGNVFTTRTISAGGIATGGGDLSANRTITVTKSTNGQAVAGTDDTTAMTPLRVADAITALSPSAFPDAPQGRLTLTSVTPVMTSTVSGANTVYYTPYKGQAVPLFNGTTTIMTDTGGELSQLTTDSTKSPTAVAASSCYDMFVWNDSGTIRCTRGAAWSNQTARGYTLSRQKGILTNPATITNGPAANRGTYVGTIASNGSSLIDWIYGGSASGGTAAFFGVWNAFNRVDIFTEVIDSGTGYTYTTATTRSANNSVGNRISFVSGFPEDGMEAHYHQRIATLAAAGAQFDIGLGFDSTAGFNTGAVSSVISVNAQVTTAYADAVLYRGGQTGLHFFQALERGDGTNANNVNGTQAAKLCGRFLM